MNVTMMADRVAWDDIDGGLDWSGLPALPGPRHCDAVVVGLGASGLAAVETLLERGLDVVGIDAGRVAAGAAGRNGGILAPGGSVPAGEDAESRARYIALHGETLAEQQRLIALLGPEAIRVDGSLHIAGFAGGPRNDDEAAMEAAELQAFQRQSVDLALVGVQVQAYEGPLGRGYLRPDTALMNPAFRATALAARLLDRAALFEHTPALAIRQGVVTTPFGELRAPHIVVAVDGKLDRVLQQLRPAVHTVRLQMIATAPLPTRVLPAGLCARDGYEWAQQAPDGRLLIGGGRDRFDTQDTFDDSTTAPVQRWIEDMVERIVDGPFEITHRWAASVGYTADRRAICTQVEEGVVACGGYCGHGNLVGPVAARAAVALVLDGTSPPSYFRGIG